MSSSTEEIKPRYTYKDYLTWPEDERWELFEGEAVAMSPAPGSRHQRVSMNLSRMISSFLLESPCEPFASPIDVLFPRNEQDDESVDTVLQPDLIVVCDPEKITKRNVRGAPDLVIEILSESTTAHDLVRKFEIYERAGVKEYWIIDPWRNSVAMHVLKEDGKYGPPLYYTETMTIKSVVLNGIKLSAAELFLKH